MIAQTSSPLASCSTSTCTWREGSISECIDQAQRVLSLQPDDAGGLYMAGRAELLLANCAQAGGYFEKCVAIDSTYGPTALGYVYLKTVSHYGILERETQEIA